MHTNPRSGKRRHKKKQGFLFKGGDNRRRHAECPTSQGGAEKISSPHISRMESKTLSKEDGQECGQVV